MQTESGDNLINLGPLFPSLSSDTLILTPNNRLKLKICAAWGEQQANTVWHQPEVQSLDEWLAQNVDQQARLNPEWPLAHKVPASAPVRRRLWAKTLAHFDATHPLVHPGKTAEHLDQAYSYLTLWQVNAAHFEALGLDQEQLRLASWIEHFQAQMDSLGLYTLEQSWVALLEQGQAGQSLPDVVLVNAETVSPLHQCLLDRFSRQWRILHTNDKAAARIERQPCIDRDTELAAAARWANDILTREPGARVALVDPNLGNRRAQVERALNRVFEPRAHLPGTPRYTPPYNFSAGTPLSSLPAIHTALLALGWHRDISLDQATQWLLSPFVGWPGDQPLRHWLASWLRQRQTDTVSRALIAQGLSLAGQQPQFESSAHPIAQWQAWMNGNFGVATSGANWGARFLQSLQACNWPGPRPLDSEEHQQVAQFYQLMERLREADWLGQHLSLSDALGWLTELASRHPFQPQTPESPVQVLGVLESTGLHFDYVWIMGMDDHQWPPAPAPNPLLPATLQRHLGMPHASAERELQYCQSITRQFTCSARHAVVFSHPLRDGDRELAPSPLIAALHEKETISPEPVQWQPAALEWLSTLCAPPVSAEELAQLRGGAALLQKQSRCPLAAFFEIRLGARRPDPHNPGLNPLDRGNLLHQALYYFWLEKPALSSITAEEQDQRINAAIDKAIAEAMPANRQRLYQIERGRIRLLLQQWLEIERQRPPFSIQALEQAQEIKLGPLPLKLRIDRIDQVNGQWLLIDYKSGSTNTRHWLAQPEEPQLPLYAIALADQGKPVAAIAFAELRQKNQVLNGLGASLPEGEIAPGIASVNEKTAGAADWSALLDHWRQSLLDLALALTEGDTQHTYSSQQSKDYLNHLQPLLRDAEQATMAQEAP
ncbi:hypothetical protein M5M_03765 [Simiduia agarivorans SA1 = DSM 21679]|uniref:PD-(D/E)XK endonuclease-like domain-containing protein n=1 Tax=Simiduia agarivorans (strain DSM 21679 / JCM 13881 / BCRC 17597 / SA1) TaxID=1117647 RepID=K4KVI1_SIMAS|nr:hypothetical protein M5M_03765 [Simiduia agarivorans SA1 = DSM 21679]